MNLTHCDVPYDTMTWWSLQTTPRNELESRQFQDHPRMLVEQDLITQGVAWHENQRGSILLYNIYIQVASAT